MCINDIAIKHVSKTLLVLMAVNIEMLNKINILETSHFSSCDGINSTHIYM